MPPLSFNPAVAARRDTAAAILADPNLLAQFVKLGGLPGDLQEIADAGKTAEALNLAQSNAKADGSAATAKVLVEFAETQGEYQGVMRVMSLVLADLVRDQAPEEQRARLEQIIANEAPVAVRTVEEGGAQKKKASRLLSHEALRAEIQKDAAALLGFAEIKDRLAARNVSAERLEALKDRAEALSGKLTDRVAKKNAAKAATQAERDAVARQNNRWGAAYRLLRALGQSNSTIADLLKAAAK